VAGPTRAEIEAKVDSNGRGATREQLAEWGVPWPPPKGWKKKLLHAADAAAGRAVEPAVVDDAPRFVPMTMGAPTLPTECCEFAVVDSSTGVEVCRVWREDDARRIARLLSSESR